MESRSKKKTENVLVNMAGEMGSETGNKPAICCVRLLTTL